MKTAFAIAAALLLTTPAFAQERATEITADLNAGRAGTHADGSLYTLGSGPVPAPAHFQEGTVCRREAPGSTSCVAPPLRYQLGSGPAPLSIVCDWPMTQRLNFNDRLTCPGEALLPSGIDAMTGEPYHTTYLPPAVICTEHGVCGTRTEIDSLSRTAYLNRSKPGLGF